MRIRKRKKNRTPIEEIVAAVEAEGLSYGKYVAKHESTVYDYPQKRGVKEMGTFAFCNRSDCFGNLTGKYCTKLKDTDFGGRPCPFYKAKPQNVVLADVDSEERAFCNRLQKEDYNGNDNKRG